METMDTTEQAETPWGQAQTREWAGIDGLYRVTTAGHGGYWLSADRIADVRREFPTFEPWAGWPWLEEDCDAMLVACLWPQLVTDVVRWEVWRMCRSADPIGHAGVEIGRWMVRTPQGKKWSADCEAWGRAHADYWTASGGWGDGTGWRQHWRRIGDGKTVTVNHGMAFPSVHVVSPGQMRAWMGESVGLGPVYDENND